MDENISQNQTEATAEVHAEVPPVAQPQYQQFQPVAVVKQRRVGTFTLGIVLILIGVFVPLTMIFKDRALEILRLAPVVLVIMGIEVLYYAIRYKEGKLKYDGVSIFLVIILTMISIGVSSIAPIVTTYVKNERIVSMKRHEADTVLSKALKNNGLRGDTFCYPSNSYDRFGNYIWYEEFTEENMKISSTVNILWEDADKVPTEQEIHQKLLPFIKDIDYPFEEIDLEIIFNGRRIAYMSLDNDEIQNADFTVKYDVETLREIEIEITE